MSTVFGISTFTRLKSGWTYSEVLQHSLDIEKDVEHLFVGPSLISNAADKLGTGLFLFLIIFIFGGAVFGNLVAPRKHDFLVANIDGQNHVVI